MKPQGTTGPAQTMPALRKLTLRRETLRRLTPAELRLGRRRCGQADLAVRHTRPGPVTARAPGPAGSAPRPI